jgi:hypothetical protein
MPKLLFLFKFLRQDITETEIFSLSNAVAHNSPTFAHFDRHSFSEGGPATLTIFH